MIKVNKPINLAQLDLELNGKGLVSKNAEDMTILEVGLAEGNDATLVELEAAIKAHKALQEPEPTVEDKLASVGLNLNDLKAALGL